MPIFSVRLEQGSSAAENPPVERQATGGVFSTRHLGFARRLLEASGIVMALALTACSGSDPDYNRVDVADQEAAAQAAIEQAVARNGAATTARTGVPIARSTPTAARDRAFPTEFLGYWGAGDNDCELANTAATGRINIDADTIRFYESRARVQRMDRRSPQELVVDLRFSGDGQGFYRREIYRLDAGGTALVRTYPTATQRYRRC